MKRQWRWSKGLSGLALCMGMSVPAEAETIQIFQKKCTVELVKI